MPEAVSKEFLSGSGTFAGSLYLRFVIRLLAPQFLFGLSLLVIPVIIHLFNFRRYRKVVFTNVRFLQELKEETTRMSRLKHLLVLASRLLAVLFLVLAFTQPVIPVSKGTPVTPGGAVSIYVDNSFSMETQSRDGALFEIARRKAREIAMAYPPSTRVQLLTNDFEAIHQRVYAREEFLDELERIIISPVSRKLSDVTRRQTEALHNAGVYSGSRFIISDFQESFADFETIDADSTSVINLVALPLQSASNVYIDSCWLASPVVQLNVPVELKVRIVNSGSEDAGNVPVRLKINGAQRAVASTELEAESESEVILTFTVNTPGWQQLEVELTDHPVTFDDRYFLSFNVREKLNVLSLDGNGAGQYLKVLFGQDPYFSYTAVPGNQVNYAAFKNQDVIILHQLQDISSGLISELQRYMQQGGTIVCFPDSAINLAAYNAFLNNVGGDNLSGVVRTSDKVSEVDLKHPVFQEVFEKNKRKEGVTDYPVVNAHYAFTGSARTNRRNLIRLAGGDPFLAEYSGGRGSFYLFTVPLSPGFSNLSRHALIVPVMYRISLLSMKAPLLSYEIGDNTPVIVNSVISGDESLHLKSESLNTDVIPAVRNTAGGTEIFPGPSVSVAGNYQLESAAGVLANVALNYNRNESPMKFLQDDELKDAAETARGSVVRFFKPGTEDIGASIRRQNEGVALWKYCIMAALLFLLAETLLLRYWKTA